MGTFLSYTLKSAFCLILFYPAYRLLLSRETFHRFNRIALLALLALSALLPLVTIGGALPTSSIATTMPQEFPTLQPQAMDAVQEVASTTLTTLSWAHVLLWIYLLGCIVYACHQLISFVRLGSLIRKAKREPMPEYINIKERRTHVRLYVHDEELAPFSWMHLIVVSRKSLEESGRAILIHELAHIAHRHSWDLLLADVCLLFQWFNPTKDKNV